MPASDSLRADAVRNRAALVAAARAVFTEQGLDAPLDEIAQRAGVGNATLYRRFPSRGDLVTAVFIDQMRDYVAAVDRALETEDPWSGFRDYVLHVLQLQASDRGIADLLSSNLSEPSGELEGLRAHAFDGVVKLVKRAKAAGALRSDFTAQDLMLILIANAGLVHRTSASAPSSWRRLAAFILDGLRAEAATPAPVSPAEDWVKAAMIRTAQRKRAVRTNA